MTRILLIEDNPDLQFAVRQALDTEGFDVVTAIDGQSGLAVAMQETVDVVILDIMLPGIDGFRVLRSLRDAGVETPVLVLTARGEEEDKLRGFRLGADDYLTKPFGVRELLARVDVLLRRRRPAEARGVPRHLPAPGAPQAVLTSPPRHETIRFGEIEVIPAARVVRRNGDEVVLRPKEMDLLLALVQRAGRVVPRAELLSHVWSYSEAVTTRTVDIHIAELRRKPEPDPSDPRHIVTVYKAGYRLDF